jgi:hypothetical protein
MKLSVIDRIMAKRRITESGCWEYTGALNHAGYGVVQIGRGYGTILVHRLIASDPVGCVLHTCHNPACFNPEHLYVGTQTDNTRDKMRAGRTWQYKLNQADADEIRERYSFRKVTMKQLAKEYGVSSFTIHRVIHRQTWTSQCV